YKIKSYYNNYYSLAKDKRYLLLENKDNLLNSNEIDNKDKNILMCILMKIYFSENNYEESERYANKLKNIETNDIIIKQSLADYYTKTRRYELASILYKGLLKEENESIQKDYNNLLGILNKTKKEYLPLLTTSKEKYIDFINGLGITEEKLILPKKKPPRIPDEDYPNLEELYTPSFNSFVAFDLETTGLSRKLDAIIEIGAIKVIDGKMIESKDFIFQELVKPYKKRISKEIETLTGITNDMVHDKRKIWEVFIDFADFIEDYPLVGYNCSSFDIKFLERAGCLSNRIINNKFYDVMKLVKRYKKALNLEKTKLDTISTFYGIDNKNAHRALSDAITTAKVYLELKSKGMK
ncbi:MAG: 3'-5' exonuclease, partial [Bacilli bacterium]|nr:3'-5' exonuclease [Bacilli bacterium]